jgi:outer membrane lipoprotein-sorting protein
MVPIRSYLAKRRIASFFLFFLAAWVAAAADLGELLDRWCAGQTNIHTWSADLTQIRSLKVFSQPLVAQGKVWVAIPNRFRWELGQPAQTIALRQPDQLLLIYPRLKRAEKYPLGDAQNGPWKDALALLDASFPRNKAELESRFRVLSLAQTNSIVTLALQPKSASARQFMPEIHVSFSTNDYTPTATELRFSDGSRMRSNFTHSILNAPLDEGLFDARLASDITVVEPLRQ